jgi:hypothetical protein
MLRVSLLKKVINSVPHGCLLNEFGGSVDIQEDTIVQALDLAGVAWPHVKPVLVNLFLVICVEELRKSPNLLVVLLIQAFLNDFVEEVYHVRD